MMIRSTAIFLSSYLVCVSVWGFRRGTTRQSGEEDAESNLLCSLVVADHGTRWVAPGGFSEGAEPCSSSRSIDSVAIDELVEPNWPESISIGKIHNSSRTLLLARDRTQPKKGHGDLRQLYVGTDGSGWKKNKPNVFLLIGGIGG
jgi:hypothetical protein